MTLKITLAALAVSSALPAMALAQSSTVASHPSANFYQQVQRDSMNEIQEALMAEQRAQDPAVKAFARLMIDDHTALASTLSAAEGNSVNNGTAGNSTQAATADQKFENLSGMQFDRAFIDHEVQQHQESVRNWTQEEKSGNGDVAVFAKFGLPVQREHLQLAEAIQAQLEHGATQQAVR